MPDAAASDATGSSAALPYNATLVSREDINPSLVVMRVQPDQPMFEFKAGQFAVLGLLGNEPRVPEADAEPNAPASDKMIRRAYSIASASLERRYAQTTSEAAREHYRKYFAEAECESCSGRRLRSESLAVKIRAHDIAQVTAKTVGDARA